MVGTLAIQLGADVPEQNNSSSSPIRGRVWRIQVEEEEEELEKWLGRQAKMP